MDAGYTVRHLHDTRVDKRLESIEKTVSAVLKVINIWHPNPAYIITSIILFNSKATLFFVTILKQFWLYKEKQFLSALLIHALYFYFHPILLSF